MKRFKKSTSITIALLIYVSATAAYFLPRNTVISDTEKYVTVAASYIIVFILWLVLRKKEDLQRKRREEDEKYNPSISGLGLSHNTETDKTSFGIEAKGGAFLLDNVALLIHAGAKWNEKGGDTDVYTLGVGGRYYFSKIGLYLGADVNVDRWDWGTSDDTKFSFGAEAGYAFFLSRTVTLEPAVYWNVNGDRSVFGLKVGFGFYF